MREFFIDTPLGKMRVRAILEKDTPFMNPGVDVDLIHTTDEGEEVSKLLCAVSYNPEQHRMNTCVFDPLPRAFVKHTVASSNNAAWVEDIYVMFDGENMPKSVEDIVTLLIEGLNGGKTSEHGDRISPYYVIAHGKRDPKHNVKVSIMEFISARYPRYLIHVIDEVRAYNCAVKETKDLSLQSLTQTIETLVNNMRTAKRKMTRPKYGPWTVRDLTADELNELKQMYQRKHLGKFADASEIPDAVILRHYADERYTIDDFFCTTQKELEENVSVFA